MTRKIDSRNIVAVIRKQFYDSVELARPSIPTMHKEYFGAIVWNPINHDFLAYGFRLYLFLFGLVVKLSLSGGALNLIGLQKIFQRKRVVSPLEMKFNVFAKRVRNKGIL